MSSIANASSETSHRDLQIRALQQASALLNAHARDAKARATKLRGTLVDRELNPEDFVSMQRERWMEERRSQARHEESKALEQLLRKLSRTNGVEVNSSLLEAEKGSGQPPGLPSPEKARLAQRHANLVYFLNRSPTRLSFSNRPSSSPHNQLHHRSQSRPRTISDVRTLRLRSSALVSAFQSPIRGRFRSRSLNADTPPTAGHQALGVPLVRGANRSTLSIPPTLGETPELDIDDSNMSLRGMSHIPLFRAVIPTGIDLIYTHLTDAFTTAGQRNVRPSPLSDGGVATIFAPDSPRSLDELASDLSDVGIPSYAQDLLNGFDNIHHDPILPSLPPPRRPILEDETLFRIPSYSHPTQSLLSVISSIHQDQGSSSTTSLSKHKSSHIGLHIPAKPRIPSSSPLRRPLSSFLPSHSRQKSDDSGASSSPPDSLSRNFADQERDEDTATGESRVLQTPVESSTYNPHIAGEKEKSGRWSVPVMPKSPGKVFGKMKTRFAVLGRRQ